MKVPSMNTSNTVDAHFVGYPDNLSNLLEVRFSIRLPRLRSTFFFESSNIAFTCSPSPEGNTYWANSHITADFRVYQAGNRTLSRTKDIDDTVCVVEKIFAYIYWYIVAFADKKHTELDSAFCAKVLTAFLCLR